MTTMTSSAFANLIETARTAASAGDTRRARRDFRNATELDPTSVEAWLGLAATAAVLRERRSFYERALALDPSCADARESIAQIDSLLAAGTLIRPRAPQTAPIVHAAPTAPVEAECAIVTHHQMASVVIPLPTTLPRRRERSLGLLAVAVIGVAAMGLLTALGIFVLTSFWGFLLAFIAGPSVSELMLWLTNRARKGLGGRPLQFAAAGGMLLGGLGAMALGGLLLQITGLPLPIEAVAMARNLGAGSTPAAVLLNNPGLLVFVGSAVAATAYRLG